MNFKSVRLDIQVFKKVKGPQEIRTSRNTIFGKNGTLYSFQSSQKNLNIKYKDIITQQHEFQKNNLFTAFITTNNRWPFFSYIDRNNLDLLDWTTWCLPVR